MIGVWWVFLAVLLASWALTGGLRRYALANRVLDIPNERSSHRLPTPRGGGVAIVLSFAGASVLLNLAGGLPWGFDWALLGAAGGIALIGFIDDHRHIPAGWRLLGHFGCAAWALFSLGGLPPIVVGGAQLELGWLGQVLAVIWLVWLLNLYNFMDGIDGIASIEAICVCCGGALLYILSDKANAGLPPAIVPPLLLACAVAGFLLWNFPPARIFMGDAGSGFLGLVLGLLALEAARVSPTLLWGWMILLGVFVVDATYTLLRRVMRGERVHEAHRSHAYQHAAQRFGHLPVTLAVAAIDLFWLLPLALWVALGELDGMFAVCVAYSPLILLAVTLRAGERV